MATAVANVYFAKTTTPSGFLEFKPRDMTTQVKYDAMSPEWQGVDSSIKAVERGDYALDSAEKGRDPTKPVVLESSSWDLVSKCVVQ